MFGKHLPLKSYSGMPHHLFMKLTHESLHRAIQFATSAFIRIDTIIYYFSMILRNFLDNGCLSKWINFKVVAICSCTVPPQVNLLCTMYMRLLLLKFCYVKEEGGQYGYHTGWPKPMLRHWNCMPHPDIWKRTHPFTCFSIFAICPHCILIYGILV